MPDARSRHVVLTGPTSGIGLAAARGLAEAGARLTLVGRDGARLAALASELGGGADWVTADLSSLEQTRRAAAEIRERHDRIDVLINNAGGMFRHREETTEGTESTLALNHLSPFVLTSELLPLLQAAADGDREFGARVVNVASSAHRSGVRWDDIQCERDYSLVRAYGHSKALMVMTTIELARRLEGSGITANGVHPGRRAHGHRAEVRPRGRRHADRARRVRRARHAEARRVTPRAPRAVRRGSGCERRLLEQAPHRGAVRGGSRSWQPGAGVGAVGAAYRDDSDRLSPRPYAASSADPCAGIGANAAMTVASAAMQPE